MLCAQSRREEEPGGLLERDLGQWEDLLKSMSKLFLPTPSHTLDPLQRRVHTSAGAINKALNPGKVLPR